MFLPIIVLGILKPNLQLPGTVTVFWGDNAGEGPYLNNYLKSKGIKCMGFMSTFLVLKLEATEAKRDQILQDYRSEFGVDLTKFNKEGETITDVPICEMKFSPPKTLKQVLSTLSKSSLLAKTIAQESKRRHILVADTFKSITYYMHPVILQNGKRGEYLSGTIEVIRNSNPDHLWFSGAQ